MHSRHHRNTEYRTYSSDPISSGKSWTGLHHLSLPRFLPPDFPGIVVDVIIADTQAHWFICVWSSEVSSKMKPHTYELSFYRVLVSRDIIGTRWLAGNFWQETETQGIKGAIFWEEPSLLTSTMGICVECWPLFAFHVHEYLYGGFMRSLQEVDFQNFIGASTHFIEGVLLL